MGEKVPRGSSAVAHICVGSWRQASTAALAVVAFAAPAALADANTSSGPQPHNRRGVAAAGLVANQGSGPLDCPAPQAQVWLLKRTKMTGRAALDMTVHSADHGNHAAMVVVRDIHKNPSSIERATLVDMYLSDGPEGLTSYPQAYDNEAGLTTPACLPDAAAEAADNASFEEPVRFYEASHDNYVLGVYDERVTSIEFRGVGWVAERLAASRAKMVALQAQDFEDTAGVRGKPFGVAYEQGVRRFEYPVARGWWSVFSFFINCRQQLVLNLPPTGGWGKATGHNIPASEKALLLACDSTHRGSWLASGMNTGERPASWDLELHSDDVGLGANVVVGLQVKY